MDKNRRGFPILIFRAKLQKTIVKKSMKNVTRSKMAVHTNDDIYTDTLGRKRKSVVRKILFYFSRFLEKVHIACINRHKIGNIHDAHVARISNLLNKEITVETFYFGKKKETERATINSVLTHECTM